ncbi:hypothetical protein [Streptomyces canus]|uniref:hypothetical protein n=1 Tax=Streptomyces canus TaxID=58343 RepID=UPI00324F8AC2
MAQKDETTYDFPKDLLEAQGELEEVRGELKILLKRQPWSVEPLAAWTAHENHWRPSSRPDSPGWDPEDQQRIGTLRTRELELAALIVGHPFWKEIAAEERADARTKLKHRRQSTEKATA